jgi:hypothetical protein
MAFTSPVHVQKDHLVILDLRGHHTLRVGCQRMKAPYLVRYKHTSGGAQRTSPDHVTIARHFQLHAG